MSGTDEQDTDDVRPLVAERRSNRGVWAFSGALVVAALLLFQVLEARRSSNTSPSTLAPLDRSPGQAISPPELLIPDQGAVPPQYPTWDPARISDPVPYADGARSDAVRMKPARPIVIAQLGQTATPTVSSMPQDLSSPAYAQVPREQSHPLQSQGTEISARTGGQDRVEATWFANPATTVPKGTVVQAVLESALDSTRGGYARAIVSRDVYGFDGSRVLIARASRLIGEYKSDASPGQNRILIQWQRLVRPDGAVIELDSPSADPLGRAGVKGSVDSHFVERFIGAVLQSSVDIGLQLAAQRASRNTYVLALPGGLQESRHVAEPEKVQRTIKIRQGTSVSVFAAKDLDFTKVEK